jgi:hypothetical protein
MCEIDKQRTIKPKESLKSSWVGLPKITNANQLVENNQISEMFLLLMTSKQVTSKKTLEEILKDIGMQVLEI